VWGRFIHYTYTPCWNRSAVLCVPDPNLIHGSSLSERCHYVVGICSWLQHMCAWINDVLIFYGWFGIKINMNLNSRSTDQDIPLNVHICHQSIFTPNTNHRSLSPPKERQGSVLWSTQCDSGTSRPHLYCGVITPCYTQRPLGLMATVFMWDLCRVTDSVFWYLSWAMRG